MIIDIDSKNRIRGASNCWNLESERIIKGKPDWGADGYYSTFANALHAAAQRELRTDPAHGIAEAMEAVNRLTDKYAAIFEGVGK